MRWETCNEEQPIFLGEESYASTNPNLRFQQTNYALLRLMSVSGDSDHNLPAIIFEGTIDFKGKATRDLC